MFFNASLHNTFNIDTNPYRKSIPHTNFPICNSSHSQFSTHSIYFFPAFSTLTTIQTAAEVRINMLRRDRHPKTSGTKLDPDAEAHDNGTVTFPSAVFSPHNHTPQKIPTRDIY